MAGISFDCIKLRLWKLLNCFIFLSKRLDSSNYNRKVETLKGSYPSYSQGKEFKGVDMAKKSQFMTKTTSFGGKKVVMFSIDGLVWSTRKEELAGIKNRLDNQKVTLDLTPKEEEGKSSEEEKTEEKDIDDGLDLPVIDTDEDTVPARSKSAVAVKSSAKIKTPIKTKTAETKSKGAKAVPPKSKRVSSKKKAA